MYINVIWPAAGRYVVAVSGGCDSMTLLDVLARRSEAASYQLIVAHYNHGLRSDAGQDQVLVKAAATRYKLPFVTHNGQLGQASEAVARAARHTFLERTRKEHDATAIITAHHQDDVIETSLLNLARGSGRRGLAPMQGGQVLRPFLGVTRTQIQTYARQHSIQWREDPTNADRSNPRNFLRHELLPAAGDAWRNKYLHIIHGLTSLNQAIDNDLANLCAPRPPGTSMAWPRSLIRDLTLAEVAELLHYAARRLAPHVEPDARLLQELALFAKTARSGRRRPLRAGLTVRINPAEVEICCF